MNKELLKWLAALGVGALATGLGYVTGHIGTGPEGLDPTVTTIVVTLLKRGVDFLTTLLGPAKPPAPSA